MPASPVLRLEREAAVADLLPAERAGQWEASGVLARDGFLYVVSDSRREVAVVTEDLDPTGTLIALPHGPAAGFEDLAVDPGTGHYLLLVEALRRGSGWMAQVEEFDEQFRAVSRAWLDFRLPSANKGLEGLTCVQRGAQTFVLGLCEGNWCSHGERGRTPGGGRIQVFVRADDAWPKVATVHLPAWLPFRDFSALAAAGDRLAVVSQESSAVWTGRLDVERWEIMDDGAVRELPRDAHGERVYCNVEGVSWIGPDRLAMVSDRVKPGEQPQRCRAKEESIHVFGLD